MKSFIHEPIETVGERRNFWIIFKFVVAFYKTFASIDTKYKQSMYERLSLANGMHLSEWNNQIFFLVQKYASALDWL